MNQSMQSQFHPVDQEKVWRNLLDYVESQDMFFPDLIRNRLNPAALEIFERYLSLMLEHEMLIPFRKQSFFNRVASWLLWLRFKLFKRKQKVPQVYVRGPGWDQWKRIPLEDLSASDTPQA